MICNRNSRESSVGIATCSIPGTEKIFLFFKTSRPALRPSQPHIERVLEAISPGAKRQGREGDHSIPIIAEVKDG
jgi:hypothetical protein